MTRSDTGSHNSLAMIQSIVPTHYVCNLYISCGIQWDRYIVWLLLGRNECNVHFLWLYDIKHHQILGRLKTKLYEKHDDFIFPIVNSTFIRNNIPVVPAYVVGITKLIHYSCDAMDRAQLWTQKLLKPSYVTVRLKSLLQQLYGHNYELSNHYEIFISQMAMQLFPFHVDMLLSTITDKTFPGVRQRVFY